MLSILSDMLHKNLDLSCLPFMLSINGKPVINTGRIFEAIIIAAIVALLGSFITIKVIEERIININSRLTTIDTKVDKIYADIYRPVIPHIRVGEK